MKRSRPSGCSNHSRGSRRRPRRFMWRVTRKGVAEVHTVEGPNKGDPLKSVGLPRPTSTTDSSASPTRMRRIALSARTSFLGIPPGRRA